MAEQAGEAAGQQTSTSGSEAAAVAAEPVRSTSSDDGDAVKHKSFETALRANLRKASKLSTEPKKAETKPEGAQTQAATPITDATAKPEPVAAATPEPSKQSAPVLAPQDMTAAERAAFEKADPALQSYLSRRALEIRQKIGEQSQQWKQIQEELGPVAPVVKQYASHMLKRGKNVGEVVENSIKWDMHIESNPVAGLLDYCEAWGVDPTELVEARGAAGQQRQPAQAQSQEPVDIEAAIEAGIQKRLQAEAQKNAVTSATAEVQSWIKTKPHFSDPGTAAQLEEALAPVVRALRASDPTAKTAALLDEALEIVLRREQFSPLRAQIEARAAAERTKAEAEEALRSSRSISGGPGSATPKVKYRSFEENLRANLRK